MRLINTDALKTILENHKHWLKKDVDGWETMKANLSGADLSGADLRWANLRWADLSGANLSGVNFHGADLRWVNLYGVNLCGANLRLADLFGANLCRVDLSGADLSGANLCRVDLSGADLSGANLFGAILYRATNIPYMPMACPDCDEFVGWKKASGYIVKLLITADSKRSSATGRKCRCSKAKVLEIQQVNGDVSNITEVRSDHDWNFIYKVGEIVEEPNFDNDRFNECAPGIHFFINREEAVNYQ